MPGLDKTGPFGQGRRSGNKQGLCGTAKSDIDLRPSRGRGNRKFSGAGFRKGDSFARTRWGTTENAPKTQQMATNALAFGTLGSIIAILKYGASALRAGLERIDREVYVLEEAANQDQKDSND